MLSNTISLIMAAVGLLLVIGIARICSPNRKANLTAKKDDSVIKVRSAKDMDTTVSFDPTDEPSGQTPAALEAGEDFLEENEITPLEEFLDPRTPAERKREIARELASNTCQFKRIPGSKSRKKVTGAEFNLTEEEIEQIKEEANGWTPSGVDEQLQGPPESMFNN